MNKVRTGCANCPFNLNAECTNPETCYGCYTLQKCEVADFANKLIGPQIAVSCPICGKQVTSNDIYDIYQSIYICDECKEAIGWAKEQQKKNASLQTRQNEDPNGFRITVKEFVQRFVPHGYSVILKEERIQTIKESKFSIRFEDIGPIVWNGKDYLITDEGTCPFKDYLVVALIVPQEKWEGKVIELSIRDPYINPYQKAEQTSSDVLEDLGILGK